MESFLARLGRILSENFQVIQMQAEPLFHLKASADGPYSRSVVMYLRDGATTYSVEVKETR